MNDDIVNDDWNFPIIMAAMKKERKSANELAALTARAEQAEAERDKLKTRVEKAEEMLKIILRDNEAACGEGGGLYSVSNDFIGQIEIFLKGGEV